MRLGLPSSSSFFLLGYGQHLGIGATNPGVCCLESVGVWRIISSLSIAHVGILAKRDEIQTAAAGVSGPWRA